MLRPIGPSEDHQAGVPLIDEQGFLTYAGSEVFKLSVSQNSALDEWGAWLEREHPDTMQEQFAVWVRREPLARALEDIKADYTAALEEYADTLGR